MTTLLDRIRMSGLSSIKKYSYVDKIIDGAHYQILRAPLLRNNTNFWTKLSKVTIEILHDGESISQYVLIKDHYDDIEL